MCVKTQLFLDVGGVLGTNLDPFWHQLAAAAAVSHEEIRRRYKHELRDALWTGSLTEAGFWDWVCRQQTAMDAAQARALLLSHLQPMAAYELLPAWCRTFDLHILSNHRVEWLTPFLAPIRSYLRSVTISSEAGCAKPSPAIYELAAAHVPPGAPILFVDDAESNLHTAASLGWQTLLADPDGRWIRKIQV